MNSQKFERINVGSMKATQGLNSYADKLGS